MTLSETIQNLIKYYAVQSEKEKLRIEDKIISLCSEYARKILVQKFGSKSAYDLDQLMSHAYTFMLDAIRKYNPGKEVTLLTYMTSKIQFSLSRVLREQRKTTNKVAEKYTRYVKLIEQGAEDDSICTLLKISTKDLCELKHMLCPSKAIESSTPAQSIDMLHMDIIISKLPDVQRVISIMFFKEELNVEFIAEKLCIPTSRVRTQLNEAKQILREKLNS